EMLLIAGFALAGGITPIFSLAVLRGLVDSAVGVAAGATPWRTAALWLAGLLLANLIQSAFDFWQNRWFGLGDEIQDRLKARAQERLLAKASRLSLANFERPESYDRLHRAQYGLDTRLFSTMEFLFPMPAHLVTALGLLLYVGSAHVLFPVVLLAGLLP